jgi:hypothetical protein
MIASRDRCGSAVATSAKRARKRAMTRSFIRWECKELRSKERVMNELTSLNVNSMNITEIAGEIE